MKADSTITLSVDGTKVTATDDKGNAQVIDTNAADAANFSGTLTSIKWFVHYH